MKTLFPFYSLKTIHRKKIFFHSCELSMFKNLIFITNESHCYCQCALLYVI
uniref:Uncharacterized protein n=1 Tax=Anguilla anguilla TaxID=7936 RepID=A0A0E9R9G5_ANGAN